MCQTVDPNLLGPALNRNVVSGCAKLVSPQVITLLGVAYFGSNRDSVWGLGDLFKRS